MEPYTKEILTDERLVTDQHLFDALDLSLDELAPVKRALQEGLVDEAKKGVVEYFHRRNNITYLFDFRGEPVTPIPRDIIPYNFQASLGLSENIKDFCLYAAEELMNHRYVKPGNRRVVYELGKHLDTPPHFNYLTDLRKQSRSNFSIFSRAQFFEYLMFKFHEDGDDNVVKKYSEYLDFFFEHYPLQVQDTSPNAGHLQFDEDRDSMNVGWLLIVYTGLLYTEMTYRLDFHQVFELLKHIWFLGIQFRRFDSDTYRPYNHHFFERGVVPFFLATMFPEIPDFVAMYPKAKKTILLHIKEDYNVDGGYNEHSIGYWSGAAVGEMIYRAVALAALNKIDLLDEDAENRLEKTLNLFALISPATEKAPTIGDKEGTLIDPFLAMAVTMTGNDYCRQLLEMRLGKRETVSLPVYYSNHTTGFTMARTGYAANDTYMLMSTKIDCGISGHNHMDMLSIIYHLRGVPFIDEPYTGFLYSNISHGSRARGFLYNMEAHNTVMCYGRQIQDWECYANRFGLYRPDTPVTQFETNENGMLVSAYHYGYTYCSHKRTVLFASTGTMMVHDEINRGNRLDTPHIQRWNLAYEVSVREYDSHSVILERDGLFLLLVWDRPLDIKVFKNIEPLKAIMSESDIGYTIDVSFEPEIDPQGMKEMLVGLKMLAIDITEKDPKPIEEYVALLKDASCDVATLGVLGLL